jgi:sialate O-acetylesterase
MRKKLFLSSIFICLTVACLAQTKLPIFFSDSMVLQRNSHAAIWGTDIANRKIIVSGSWGKTDSVISDNTGKWKLTLETPTAGGPFTLTAIGSTTVIVRHIQIGEVWLCAGQSNMEMPVKGYTAATPPQTVDSSDFFVANSLNPHIRVFMSGWNGTSKIPLNDISVGNWRSASPATTPNFSATAYFFARKLQETLGIPIGIIVTARGGSSIESWMDSATLATVKPVVIPNVVNWQDAQATHTIIYNTMLHPFIGFTMKGIIWSQGEANRSNHFEYQEMFTKLINSWRTKWNQGEFPFYFAQVAPNGGTANFNAALLREAQLNTMLTVNSTGMASTMDIGVQGQDHYPKKKVVGDRLAQWALIKDYGRAGTPSGPIVKSMIKINDTINLKFDYTDLGLTSFGMGLSDFEIAGANKVFYPATVTAADFNFSLNIRSSNVPNPLYVNYGFKNYVVGSLYNRAGLPASSFRTENIFTILPVTFGEINVTQKKGIRTIAFNTLAENNINNFELQASMNGIEFSYLTRIDAKNRSAFYKYDDNSNINNATVYYRLKANNINGTNEYSQIVKSSLLDKESGIKIINPSYSGVNLVFTSAFTGSINISDNSGKTIAIKQLNNYSGNLRIALPRAYKGTAVVSFISTDNKSYTELVNIL